MTNAHFAVFSLPFTILGTEDMFNDETGLEIHATDCFRNLPFPKFQLQQPASATNGETYHEHRRQIMLARQEGLTATYNRFHNPDERAADIARLRELHVEMDRAVAAAYGWDDLDLGHGFHETAQGVRFTISEAARREVLGRLLELNHQRYAEEVAAGGMRRGRLRLRSRLRMQPRQRPRINVAPSRTRRRASRVRTSSRC